jgi:hypothetical protein
VAVVTSSVVSPVVPSSTPTRPPVASAPARRTLPLPDLPPPSLLQPECGTSLLCGIAAIDVNGRLADGTVIPSLDWAVNTRLDIRVHGGLVVVTADPQAVFRVTRPGQVRLPATVRHWCTLTAGSRVLLVADPPAGRLVVHPPAALDVMISQYHATVFGGETP